MSCPVSLTNVVCWLLETESENEFRPLDGRIDEFHPKATRTLFIGNLEKTTSYQQLLDIFQRFGEIVVCVELQPKFRRFQGKRYCLIFVDMLAKSYVCLSFCRTLTLKKSTVFLNTPLCSTLILPAFAKLLRRWMESIWEATDSRYLSCVQYNPQHRKTLYLDSIIALNCGVVYHVFNVIFAAGVWEEHANNMCLARWFGI